MQMTDMLEITSNAVRQRPTYEDFLFVDAMILAGIRTGLQLLQYTRLITQLNGRGAMDLEEQHRREMVERQQVVA